MADVPAGRAAHALPVLSADALSSVVYGPEAMLAVLVLGGSAALGYSLPIAAAIAFLILAVGVSYRQTIRAYPHGGGSYIVATENLGRVPGLAAAAGLLTDYILTVAVSIASGVAAVTSAVPALAPAAVPIGTGTIALFLLEGVLGKRLAEVVALIGVLRRGRPHELVLDGRRRRLWLYFAGNCSPATAGTCPTGRRPRTVRTWPTDAWTSASPRPPCWPGRAWSPRR